MPTVQASGKYSISPGLPGRFAPFEWTPPDRDGLTRIRCTVLSGISVEVSFEAEISEALAVASEAPGYSRAFATSPKETQKEAYGISHAGFDLARIVAEIAFALAEGDGPFPSGGGLVRVQNADDSKPALSWSENGKRQGAFPSEYTVVAGVTSKRLVNDAVAGLLSMAMSAGYRPLFAWHHIDRAERDHDPRGILIDSVTAAELGIKEFLVESYPAFEDYILKAPSPPIVVLYGKVLEKAVGESGLYMKELGAAVEERNRIVHKPSRKSLDPNEAAQHLFVVRTSLLQLEWFRLQRATKPWSGAKLNVLVKLMPYQLQEFWVKQGKATRKPEPAPVANSPSQASSKADHPSP